MTNGKTARRTNGLGMRGHVAAYGCLVACGLWAAGAARAADWPMWGYDAARSGASPEALALSEPLHLQWHRTLAEPRRAWPAQWDDGDKLEFDRSYSPVVYGERLFVASMTADSLTAYAVDTGDELWRFYAGGPMRLAPAVWEGKVYAVSDDGYLYCLDAETGALRWSFQAAPVARRVLGNERVIGMWPARGGPVVFEGTVYFAAGVWPFLGTFLYALDAGSGELAWANTGHATTWQAQPHGGAYAFAGLAPQGYLAAAPERLVSAGGRSLPGLFDRHNGRMLHSQVRSGKLQGGYRVRIQDEFYFNHGRRYSVMDGSGAGAGQLEHPARAALQTLTDSVADSLDGPVFESLVARGRLWVVTDRGSLYCFGPQAVEPVQHDRQPTPPPSGADDDAVRRAADLLERSGARSGYALVLGAGDGNLAEQLALQSDLHVVVTEADENRVRALRRRYDDAGLYGTRIAVLHDDPATAAYPPYISSLVVLENPALLEETSPAAFLDSVYERLRPYDGVAVLRIGPEDDSAWAAALVAFDPQNGRMDRESGVVLLTRTGPLPGAGQWTHQHADAAQSVLSHDDRVRPPFGPVWFGGPTHHNVLPRHAAGPRPQVAGGRLVILGVETISARCVFTGRELWVRSLPGIGHPFTNLSLEERWREGQAVYMTNQPGATYIGSPYVTLPDAIYVRYRGQVLRLDPASGGITDRWDLPARSSGDGPSDWGHLSVLGDYVITTTDPHIFSGGGLGTTADRWDGSSSARLVVLNRHSGDVAWVRDATVGFRHNAIASAGDRLYINDLLSERAVEMAVRRGLSLSERPRLQALDLRTGEVLWHAESEVFGTFLSYSQTHDILIEGGSSDGRGRLEDEPLGQMIARRGQDGTVLWRRSGAYNGPVILRGEEIISARPGPSICLLSGEDSVRTNPLTGEESSWNYWRAYGCGTANASPHLLLFRSGAAGFADLEHDGGTGSLGGFRSGCTSSLIPADGILNAPDYTRTCTCSYQNQTSLGLIHMPEMELWTVSAMLGNLEGTIERLGLNLGAPGDRRADDGMFWMHFPQQAPSPDLHARIRVGEIEDAPVAIVAAHSGVGYVRDTLDGDPDSRWQSSCRRRGTFRDAWLTYTLNETVELDQVQIAWEGPLETRFRIETFDKDESYALDQPLPTEGWRFRVDPEGVGEAQDWFDPAQDDSDWDTLPIGQAWNEFEGYETYIGAGWYRRTIDVPERPATEDPEEVLLAVLAFEGVDESSWVWLNGRFVGTHNIGPSGWNLPFNVRVGEAIRWGAENQVTVRALNTVQNGGIWRPVHLRVIRDGWRTVYEGRGQGAGPTFKTYRFNPVRAWQVRLTFLDHGDDRANAQGLRHQHFVAVRQVRIGNLPYPASYTAFLPLGSDLFRKHSLWIDGAQGLDWVAASGISDIRELLLHGVNGDGHLYDVTLHFLEPDALEPGQRRFEVRVGERVAAEDFDVCAVAGGPDRAVTLRVRDVPVGDDLRITLTPAPGSEYPPVLGGVSLERMGQVRAQRKP